MLPVWRCILGLLLIMFAVVFLSISKPHMSEAVAVAFVFVPTTAVGLFLTLNFLSKVVKLMSEDKFDRFEKNVVIVAVAVIAISVIAFLIYLCQPTSFREITGKVVDVRFNPGGYGSGDITTVYLDTGQTVVLNGYKTDITIGASYIFRWVTYRSEVERFYGYWEADLDAAS